VKGLHHKGWEGSCLLSLQTQQQGGLSTCNQLGPGSDIQSVMVAMKQVTVA